MKQKFAYMSVGVIFTLILSFTWLSFASSTTEVAGKLTAIEKDQVSLFDGQKKWNFTINPDTIIYRNDKKVDLFALTFQDEVKVLLNSNEEVRYVVATYKEQENVTALKAEEPIATVPVSSPTPVYVDSQSQETVTPQKQQVTKVAPIQPTIRELEVELEAGPKNKFKLKYKNKNGKVEAEVEKETEKEKTKTKNDEAVVRALIQKMDLSPEMGKQEITEKVLSALGIDQELKKFKIKIKFINEKEVEIEVDNKGKGKSQNRGNGNGNGNAYGKQKWEDDSDEDDDNDD